MWREARGQRQENNCTVPRGQAEIEAEFGAKAKKQKKMNATVSWESSAGKMPELWAGLQ